MTLPELICGAERYPPPFGLPGVAAGLIPAAPAPVPAPPGVSGFAFIGMPGATGAAGSDLVTYTAALPLSGHRVVVLGVAGLRYPDLAAPADALALIGLTTGASAAGALTDVRPAGVMDEPSWDWTPGGPVYCGAAGLLTQIPPLLGWLRIIGTAVSPTRLLVALREPIMRQE